MFHPPGKCARSVGTPGRQCQPFTNLRIYEFCISARPPGASMQIHFKFRCRFTLRCNINIRNYTHMTIMEHNQVQSLNGTQCHGHAPIAMRGGGSGPDRPLCARRVFRDPIEAPRRQQSLLRARRRLVERERVLDQQTDVPDEVPHTVGRTGPVYGPYTGPVARIRGPYGPYSYTGPVRGNGARNDPN